MKNMIKELDKRREAALAGGGAKRMQRQHDKGKLTARAFGITAR